MIEKYYSVTNKITYLQSPLFLKNNISHCFTTRIGGVSEGPFKSLNLACGAGELRDSKENVYKNHELVANIFGLTAADICKTVQEHTADILYADETFRGVGLTKPQFNFAVDGLVTDKSGVLLSVRAADCVPILFCDKRAGVVAALHSGWRGTAQNAPVNALNIMCEHGSSIKDIVVAIGPSIKGCCYDVGIELFERFMALDSDYAAAFARRNGKWYLNLTQIIEKMLVNTDVSPEKISICPDCTKCNNNLYFSHRLSGANRGTMGAFICV